MAKNDLKIVLVGNKSVGKTSLFNRYVYNIYKPTSMTMGCYFSTKPVTVGSTSWKLLIWDTAGEEKYLSLTSFYCRGAKGALVCYDLTDYDSFKGLDTWINKIQQESNKECVIILVGTKLDVIMKDSTLRKVPKKEIMEYAKSIGAGAIETSSKLGTNISELFTSVLDKCIDVDFDEKEDEDEDFATLGQNKRNNNNDNNDGNGKRCCNN